MSYSSYLDNPFASSEDMFYFAHFITDNIHIARNNFRNQMLLAHSTTSNFTRQSHVSAARLFSHQEEAFRRVWDAFLNSLDTYAKYEIFEFLYRRKHNPSFIKYLKPALDAVCPF